jgi:hypothetical protein
MFSVRLQCAVVLMTATISGCAAPTPHLDSRFGHAVQAAKSQQIINPDASRNADPVAGLDGTPAKDSIERYQNTFKEPPPTFEIFFGAPAAASGR